MSGSCMCKSIYVYIAVLCSSAKLLVATGNLMASGRVDELGSVRGKGRGVE